MNQLGQALPKFRVATLSQAASTYSTIATIDPKCKFAIVTLGAIQVSGTASKANWSFDSVIGLGGLCLVHTAPSTTTNQELQINVATTTPGEYWKDRKFSPGDIIQGKNDPVTSTIVYYCEIMEYF